MTISKNAIANIPANNEKLAELTQRLESIISSTFKKSLQEFREDNRKRVHQWMAEEKEEEHDESFEMKEYQSIQQHNSELSY